MVDSVDLSYTSETLDSHLQSRSQDRGLRRSLLSRADLSSIWLHIALIRAHACAIKGSRRRR
jgi:hypothetical protein